jgi:riboflavin synthase
VTTLSALAPGSKVNLEIDLIARYVARMAEFDAADGAAPRA